MPESHRVFEIFQNRQRTSTVSAAVDARPQILVAAEGRTALRFVNSVGKSVEVDHRSHSGALRALIKAWILARGQEEISFGWDDAGELEDGVDLGQFPELLPLLHQYGSVADASMRVLQFAPGRYEPGLRVEPDEAGKFFQTRLILHHPDGSEVALEAPLFLGESFVLEGERIYRTEPIGAGYAAVSHFSDRVPLAQIDLFLTLFVSNFPGLRLGAPGYVTEEGSAVEARPALLFREVDGDSNLLIEVSYDVPKLPPDFVRSYDVARMCQMDAEEHKFRVRDVMYADAAAAREGLISEIKRMKRKVSGPRSFYHFEDDATLVLGADLASEFLGTSLATVATRFTLLGTEKLKRYKIVHEKPKLHLRLSSGIDFLEGDATLEIAGERISLLDAIAQFRKNAYIRLADGNQAVIDADYLARLGRLFKKSKSGVKASFFDLPMIDELAEAGAVTGPLARSREIFRGINDLAKRKVPLPRFKGKLRPYQTYGLRWLDYLHEHKLGGCLADDMGLGKTVQAIALFSRIYPKVKKPTLLVMPRSLLFNWMQELENFAPELSCYLHYGADRAWSRAAGHQIILTTYGTLRSDVESIATTEFHAVVLDESQAIKNTQTQTTQAVFALKAEFRLALSGTPLENNLGELYALFRFLNPAMFPVRADFDRDYAVPIQKHDDTDAATELRRKIYPFVLRRLKSEVLKDLPPKVEQTLYVDMGDAQKAHYEDRRRFYSEMIQGEIDRNGVAQSQFLILEAMLELRQIATIPEAKTDGRIPSAKTERLLEALEEAVANGHKCLVFTNFLAGVEQVSEALAERGITHQTMTGATRDRQALVERFQNDPKVQVFVMTLKTGGVGLNLTAADAVYVLDPWWNTSAESQAVDRAHRIGQQNTVFTYRLITRGTIEEKIQKLQAQKQSVVDQIVTTESSALKSLTETDIESLFNQ